uniref:Uncharacterized protein n=1 Tax=Leersia perrieri TaxID=77586 RepID=A0A0D9XMA3_9ORYZ
MESSNGIVGGAAPRRLLSRSASTTSAATRAGAFVYDGMRPAPLFSSTNFARSLRKAATFSSGKKNHAVDDDGGVKAAPPRRALSSKENTMPAAAASGPWEPKSRRRRGSGSSSPESDAGNTPRTSSVTAARKKFDEAEKEEAAHRARMLAARLLQNIQAAKRMVAQRRRQKLKLARLLRPQLAHLAAWDPLARPHADAVDGLAAVLAAACTAVPLAAGAQGDVESLQEAMFACVDTVNEIEANADTFFATAGVTSSTLEELVRTIKEEVEGLQEAMRLAKIVTSLQVQEVSLRANLIQANKQKLDMGASVPSIANSGWACL